MKIHVTKRHIDCGGMGSHNGSPLALAFQEAGMMYPRIDLPFVVFRRTDNYHAYAKIELPEWLVWVMRYYNATGDIQPFSFDIDLPENATVKGVHA